MGVCVLRLCDANCAIKCVTIFHVCTRFASVCEVAGCISESLSDFTQISGSHHIVQLCHVFASHEVFFSLFVLASRIKSSREE